MASQTADTCSESVCVRLFQILMCDEGFVSDVRRSLGMRQNPKLYFYFFVSSFFTVLFLGGVAFVTMLS